MSKTPARLDAHCVRTRSRRVLTKVLTGSKRTKRLTSENEAGFDATANATVLRHNTSTVLSHNLDERVPRILSVPTVQTVDQILRVDHAGECGAIRIYRSQISIARRLHPACVAALEEMLSHELQHFQTFDNLLKVRGVRPCYALPFWMVGGWVLGTFTALLGERAIWVCTAAIENTVNAHLDHQVAVLSANDSAALAAVESIRRDEAAHEDHAVRHGGESGGLYRALRWIVKGATSLAIWLSTKL
jgi:3-demethoxyubiquinol 3-hydroxylase